MRSKVLMARGCLLLSLFIITGLYSTMSACTGIFYGDKKMALAGNNEDWMSPFTRLWFIPAEPGKYGQIFFGFQEGGYQGGMNDQGLFFDGFALKPIDVKPDSGKEAFPGNLALKAMNECRSVQEVIALYERYDRSDLAGAQLFFADKDGESVIIEARAVIRKSGPWQLVTNFRQSDVLPETITDPRYCIARQMVQKAPTVDIDLFRRIMAATHQEGRYPTQYTNICDLKNGLIYLYRFHNYEQSVFFDLKEELKKGPRVIEMSSLFPASHAATAFQKEIEKAMAQRLAALTIIPQNNQISASLAGEYSFPDGMLAGYTITIALGEQGLSAAISSLLEPTVMQALSETEYVVNGLEEVYRFTFSPQTSQEAAKLKVSMMGMEAVAIRKK